MAKVFMHDQTSETLGVKIPNAKLTVNCPGNATVTVTSGEDQYVTIADETNKAVFTGLTHGLWNINMTDGLQTINRNINIITDYEITLEFFSATIDITYPNGSTCTCTNGITTYTAPDTSGKWSCNVPCAGTWTITFTDGDLTKSEDIEISFDGQYIEKAVSYYTATINVAYPNGAICSCANEADIYSASNTTGNWSFVVHETGEWTITATDGVQTISKTVYINHDGQTENVIIKFFASTVNITYPPGATCSCSDGITNFAAPNTSGDWSVIVPRIGLWRITASDGIHNATHTVEINEDGQIVDIVCEFFSSYINVTYPVETFKIVLWYIDSYGNRIETGVDTSSNGSCRFIITQAGEYEVGAYRVSPYVGIEDVAGDYTSDKVIISTSGEIKSITLNYNTLPEFTYTGTYKVVNDAGEAINQTNGDWNIIFLTTGLFTPTKLNGANNGIDVFVLGGGGNGGGIIKETYGGYLYTAAGGGGGGGYRENSFGVTISANSKYEITIGGPGGASSAFGVSASAGNDGGNAQSVHEPTGGGNGGSGGSRGGKGTVAADGDGLYEAYPNLAPENGSYPFFGTSGVLYGPGGAGGYAYNGEINGTGPVHIGGKDGGGNSSSNAATNSGGGGGGGSYASYGAIGAGSGGSGIVIIRNKR